MSRLINYERISEAITYYGKRKYKYIEVPWLVSKESIDVTRPEGSRYFETFMGSLVASGEQSFLEIREDLCPSRKYQCATPCFRDEAYDELHLPYFFKVELIIVLWKDDDVQRLLSEMWTDAFNFFCIYGQVELVSTDIGVDLNMFGYEVGSYGYREDKGFRWIYGTGLAEPRLGQILEKRQLKEEMKIAKILKSDANAQFEPCGECGNDYPREELLAGEVYCEPCREIEKSRQMKKSTSAK